MPMPAPKVTQTFLSVFSASRERRAPARHPPEIRPSPTQERRRLVALVLRAPSRPSRLNPPPPPVLFLVLLHPSGLSFVPSAAQRAPASVTRSATAPVPRMAISGSRLRQPSGLIHSAPPSGLRLRLLRLLAANNSDLRLRALGLDTPACLCVTNAVSDSTIPALQL